MNLRSLLALAATVLAAGCASSGALLDGDAVNPQEGYVLIKPYYSIGRSDPGNIDLELTRISADGKTATEFFRAVETYAPTILKLKPGFYYLSSARGLTGYYRYTFDARLTLFEVRAGQLNYPGDWLINSIVVATEVESAVSKRPTLTFYNSDTGVRRDRQIERAFRAKYPLLAATLTPIYTRVEMPGFGDRQDPATDLASTKQTRESSLPELAANGIHCSPARPMMPISTFHDSSFKRARVLTQVDFLPPGQLGVVKIVESSGFPALDTSVVEAIHSITCTYDAPLTKPVSARQAFTFQRE